MVSELEEEPRAMSSVIWPEIESSVFPNASSHEKLQTTISPTVAEELATDKSTFVAEPE